MCGPDRGPEKEPRARPRGVERRSTNPDVTAHEQATPAAWRLAVQPLRPVVYGVMPAQTWRMVRGGEAGLFLGVDGFLPVPDAVDALCVVADGDPQRWFPFDGRPVGAVALRAGPRLVGQGHGRSRATG